MKVILGFKVLALSSLRSLFAGLAFGTSAFAQVQHSYLINLNSKTVTDLGTLGGTGIYDYAYASGINDAGRVVGYSSTGPGGQRAFITGPNGVGMTDLGSLDGFESSASGINAAGQAVLNSSGLFGPLQSPGGHAFITGPNGVGSTNLGTLGGVNSYAVGINRTGQVVGAADLPVGLGEPPPPKGNYATHVFITGPNGVGMTGLAHLGDVKFGGVQPAGINAAGQVAGTGGDFLHRHAVITGPNGMGMTDLGTLGGKISFASGINDTGQVVGRSITAAGSYHAFITGPNGVGMTDLGTLGGGYSEAAGINEAGQVVGYSRTPAGSYHAFITGPNGVGMSDLNTLVHMPDGVVLTNATGINNVGQIIAVTTPVPEPETYALLLTGLGLIGVMAHRRKPA